jgi:membrane protease subunit (stomatin/prohibitin family)
MGLFDKLMAELVDIVEWIDDPGTTIVWRFPRYHNQIKNGARLIVRPGQVAIFVHEGQLADVFDPGTYELTTRNLPILATLQGWKHGFESPFKSEVYFVSTRQITGLKWGTPNPVMMRDPDFGPIRLRAFGTYNLQATDPRALLRELVGTDASFEAEAISELLRSMIITAFSELVSSSQVAALDLATKQQQLSETLRGMVVEKVDDEYGLDVPQLFIVNISLPEQVEKAIDARTSMGVLGDLDKYQQYQMAEAMKAAATNPSGGGAAEGMGMGMGFAMAGKMMQGAQAAPAAAPAMPPPAPAVWHVTEAGQTLGPFTAQQLSEAAAAGRLAAATLVWRQGLAGWTPAGQVGELAAILGAVPPPPPPA